jgi:N-methylhydantoinase A
VSELTFHVGIDVGGTFTDLVASRSDGALVVTKVPTTTADPSLGILEGLEELARGAAGDGLGSFLERVEVVVHGSTVATNAMLTGRGAKTGLITTQGFRDALEMRRGVRERLYDNKYAPPEPLVPRYLRLGVKERIDVAGAVVTPLDESDVRKALTVFREQEVESVAVCFMHAYVNGDHERQAAAVIEREWPDVYACISHELLPERKFYERVSTTSINAFVGPILRRYLHHLEGRLQEQGFRGPLRVMKSNGGLMSPAVAVREGAHTILSGPAGAVAAATYLSQVVGTPNVILVDMGGTSFDVTLIEDSTPLITRDSSVARHRLMLPALDIHTVGAGGGSIAFVDAAGLLDVGPASAGSTPGPACYGRGGELPTVTDADVVLGYIDPDFFLGGRMTLDPEASAAAIDRHVAEPLALSTLEAASGIYDVINAKMAAAIREVSVQRGYDPRRFVLIVGGGASAVHVCAIAHDIGIGEIVIPRDPGVFSAFGMLTTDFKHDFVRTFPAVLAEADVGELRDAFAEMRAQGEQVLEGEGVPAEARSHVFKLDLRYEGQVHEVDLTVAEAELGEPGLPDVHRRFHERHAAIYAYATENDPVEVVNLRLTSVGETWKVQQPASEAGGGKPAPKGRRSVYFGHLKGNVEVEVYDGHAIGPGAELAGPVIVELLDTSIVVDDHYDFGCDEYGNFHLRAKAAADGE